jgi:hypothetical protein
MFFFPSAGMLFSKDCEARDTNPLLAVLVRQILDRDLRRIKHLAVFQWDALDPINPGVGANHLTQLSVCHIQAPSCPR